MPRTVHPFEPDPQDKWFPLDDGSAHSQQQRLLGRAPPQSFADQPPVTGTVPRRLPQFRSIFNKPFSKGRKHLRFELVTLAEGNPQEAVSGRGCFASLALLGVTPVALLQAE